VSQARALATPASAPAGEGTERARSAGPDLRRRGVLLFVAGDVTWLIARQRNRSIDLRLTGSLITVGVVLVVIASVLRST